MELIEVNFNDEGDIIDTLSGKILKDTPEERVRQRFINILQSDYGYPQNIIAREVPVQQGSKILSSDDGAEIRADIVVYTSKKACLERDQGNILFVLESFNRFLIISLDVLICRYSPLFRAFPALFISEEPHKSFYYPLCFRSQK